MTIDPDRVKQRARANFIEGMSKFLLVFVVLIAIGFLVLNAVQGYQSRKTLLDCTTPNGACYQRGQEQTAKVVAQIIEQSRENSLSTQEITQISVACADVDGTQTVDQIKRCVERQVNERKG